MKNIPKSWGIEEYIDVKTVLWYEGIRKERESKGGVFDMEDIMELLRKKARDHARLPMQVSCR
jgi:oligo-1,6-glucosidase